MKKHIISPEEYEAVKEARKKNRDKRIDKRLRVIELSYEGVSQEEIGKRVGYSRKYVSQLCAAFKQDGLARYAALKYGGNNRNMSEAEEEEILREFREKAEKGQVVRVTEIKQAFDKKLGRDTGRGYIYMLLARHGWRKVMPRPKHPKRASGEDIESSKKKFTIE